MSGLSRRGFLQIGLAGAAFLAVTHLLERPAAAADASKAGDSVVRALVPVVLAGALPAAADARSAAVDETVQAFGRAVSGLAPAIRDEIDQLLGTLRLRPARYLLTGLWDPLESASPAEIAGFLSQWRESRFDLLRSGYQALTQLIQASWYDNPRSWPAIGYPGPPVLTAP
jgi:hypothetical protein